jgi:segregation and condensation protein A
MEALTNKADYRVSLDAFEGPMDLLLHLIKKNDIDIYDIPITLILEQYLAHVDIAKELNIDLAGDFLLLAAELIHIKSRLLMPLEEEQEEEEGEDPRAELVRRLIEYQRYKDASEKLMQRPMLGKDVFTRGETSQVPEEDRELEADMTSLLVAFQKVLQRLPQEKAYEIQREELSISDKIMSLTEKIKHVKELKFSEIFDPELGRFDLVISFLALLEMAKLHMIRIKQGDTFDEIYVVSKVSEADEEKGVSYV